MAKNKKTSFAREAFLNWFLKEESLLQAPPTSEKDDLAFQLETMEEGMGKAKSDEWIFLYS